MGQFELLSSLRFPLLLGLITSAVLVSCGEDTSMNNFISPGPTECPEGSALILVHDGFLTAACGCQETTGAPVRTDLSCTISKDTIVIFDFQTIHVPHQILSVGSPGFVSSPLMRQDESELKQPFFSVSFTESGTYRFQDAFQTQLNGQIIVTP